MAGLWSKQFEVRPEAAVLETYNEGDAVFQFDESSRAALQGTAIGEHGADVLGLAPSFRAEAAGAGLLAIFDVERDCDVCGYTMVGPPATEGERALGRWVRRQSAALALPTGRMRLETVLSLSLGPEEPTEDALIVEAPPGDYDVEFLETDRNLPSGTFPRILLTLTPRQPTAVPPAPPSVRVAADASGKYAEYTISDGTFRGLISGDGTLLNLDAVAAAELGWPFLATLEVSAGKQRLEALYMGRLGAANYALLGTPPSGASPDWIGTDWRTCEEFRYRRKGLSLVTARGFPAAGLENRARTWRDVTARVVGGPPAEPPLPADAEVDANGVSAEVVVRSRKVLVLSVSRGALRQLGAAPARRAEVGRRRERLRHAEQRVRPAQPGEERKALRAALEAERARQEALPLLTPASSLLLSVGGIERELVWAAAERDFTSRDQTDEYSGALLGVVRPHWSHPEREVLWIESDAYDLFEQCPFDLGLTPSASTRACIRVR